ncbi:MAG: thioredoxin family protein [Candidatus Moranbacteria bacterium]|nr:thioredoxin family protein [Candidatus Moranbacteria bacterium]
MKIVIGILVVVAVVGGYMLFGNKDTATPNVVKQEGSNSVAVKSADKKGEAQPAVQGAGSYEVYDPAKLAKAKDGKVVLFFKASWCPSCKALDKDIRENLKDIPENITILEVDYDTYTDLKKKYGVVIQHTLVQVDADGNQIEKWSASPTLADVVSKVK